MFFFRCVICNTSFATAQLVKEHITTHLAGLPFPCEKCDYCFETAEQLEEHELKHAEMEYEEQIEKEVIKEALQNGELPQVPNEDIEEETSITEYTINDFSNSELTITSSQKANVEKGKHVKKHTEVVQNELEITKIQGKDMAKSKTQINMSNKINSPGEEEVEAGLFVPFLKDEVDSDVEELGIPQEGIVASLIFIFKRMQIKPLFQLNVLTFK